MKKYHDILTYTVQMNSHEKDKFGFALRELWNKTEWGN